MLYYKIVLPNLLLSVPKQTQYVDVEVKYSLCVVGYFYGNVELDDDSEWNRDTISWAGSLS
jgi:hypothetical protein